jgi:hypothetical protein
MEQIKFRLTSAAPLLMHNAQLVDPLNTWNREIKRISGKRKKVDADHAEIARLEYLAGLYLTKDGKKMRPCVPSTIIEACLLGAARTQKRGKQVQAGVIVPSDAILEYDGPVEPRELAASSDFVLRTPAKVGQARVMRTRPMFRKWSAVVPVDYHATDLDRDTIVDLMQIAGEIIGFGDWRPKFGRFTSEVAPD